MKGAIPIQFQLQSYFFMTGIPIIKAISVKGAILIQFKFSHHLKLIVMVSKLNVFSNLYIKSWTLRPRVVHLSVCYFVVF